MDTADRVCPLPGCGLPAAKRGKYCCKAHSYDHRKLDMTTDRTCLHCGKPITRKEGENGWSLRNRKYCDIRCANRVINLGKKTKVYKVRDNALEVPESKCCERCGTIYTRRIREARKDYLKRRFCSVACVNNHPKTVKHSPKTRQLAATLDFASQWRGDHAPKRGFQLPYHLQRQYDSLPAAEQAKVRAAWGLDG